MDNIARNNTLRSIFLKAATTKDIDKAIEKQFKDNLNVSGFEIIRYRNGKHNSINMNFAVQDEYEYKDVRDAIIRVGARLGYTVRRVDKVNIFIGKRGIKVYKAFMFGECPNVIYSESVYNRTTNYICQQIANSLYDFVVKYKNGRPFENGKRIAINSWVDMNIKFDEAPLYFYKSRGVYTAVIDYLHKNILPSGEKYSIEFDDEIIGSEYHYKLSVVLN